MNIENIHKAIEIMKRAKNLDMVDFQSDGGNAARYSTDGIAYTEEDLHSCGNTACFAGYIAISEEFRADGGYTEFGSPILGDFDADGAVAAWLGINPDIANNIVYGGLYLMDFIGKDWSMWEPEDVIKILEGILDGSLESFRNSWHIRQKESFE